MTFKLKFKTVLNSKMDRSLAFVSLLLLSFGRVESDIVTAPVDTLAVEGSKVVLNCVRNVTNVLNPMNWAYLPVGSNNPVYFYSAGAFYRTDPFYANSFKIDTSLDGHYDLIIPNVTSRHAGLYACDDYKRVSGGMERVVAELNVLKKNLDCRYLEKRGGNAVELEMTCNMTMRGNSEPTLKCTEELYKSTTLFTALEKVKSNVTETNASFTATAEPNGTCFVRSTNPPRLIRIRLEVDRTLIIPAPSVRVEPFSFEIHSTSNLLSLTHPNVTERMRGTPSKFGWPVPIYLIVSIGVGVIGLIVVGTVTYKICKDRIENNRRSVKFRRIRYQSRSSLV